MAMKAPCLCKVKKRVVARLARRFGYDAMVNTSSEKPTATLSGRIMLAPMEGVVDAPMRALLTSVGGFDRCVTEFIRVTDVCLPPRVFHRLCPELEQGGHTPSGVPVYVQLLGNNAQALALNAQRAVNLGALGIDLNFGCPAKTVNKSQGGSILLRQPDLVASLVAAVRDAVPSTTPVTAKIRLGYDNADALEAIVAGVRAAGATELTIHARTKFDGYKPPAYWQNVAVVTAPNDASTNINGEIWTPHDALQACHTSGCRSVMLARGALGAPDLAARLACARQALSEGLSLTALGAALDPMPWPEVQALVYQHFVAADCQSPRHVGNRTKQWLAYLRRNYPQALTLFRRIKTLRDSDKIAAVLNNPTTQHEVAA